MTRNLYRQIAQVSGSDSHSHIEKFCEQFFLKHPDVNRHDIQIVHIVIGLVGENVEDPFESVYFYDKKENTNTYTIKKSDISALINNQLQEIRWQLICKNPLIYSDLLNDYKLFETSKCTESKPIIAS